MPPYSVLKTKKSDSSMSEVLAEFETAGEAEAFRDDCLAGVDCHEYDFSIEPPFSDEDEAEM